ncbi:unnamed protein product, partial [Hymenolepis diminuta]
MSLEKIRIPEFSPHFLPNVISTRIEVGFNGTFQYQFCDENKEKLNKCTSDGSCRDSVHSAMFQNLSCSCYPFLFLQPSRLIK